jgi:hypothetical protein
LADLRWAFCIEDFSMSDKKTVFVVGAGASFEMGLPVGDKLKELISDLLGIGPTAYSHSRVGDDLIYTALRQTEHLFEPTVNLGKLVQAAGQIAHALPLSLSIDNYLHNHNGDKAVELCGKLAIVRTILSAEADSSLFIPNNNFLIDFNGCANAWLVPFMRLLSEDCNVEKLRERLDTVTFIVFNYDRCIEQFLMHAIMTVYRVSPDEAAELASCVAIYHPYGIVGNLPWMNANGNDVETIDFGGKPDCHKLLKLARGIKTFTEGTDDDSSDIIAIRRSMQEAGRFVFLGFAYHRLNMQLLLGDTPKSRMTRRVFGTAYGMSNSDTQLVNESLGNSLNAPSIAVKNELTCFKLFHEFSRTLGFA